MTERDKKAQRSKERLRRLLALLGVYLDDLLMLSAGVCFTVSAGTAFGCSAAFAAAGACLVAYSIVVARAKGGGDSR